MSVLEVDGLTKKFGGLVAVDDFSFEVGEGEIVGLIGPNGSGKSTVFNCIMGIYGVTDGAIRFNGTDITDDSTHEVVNKGLSRVSQESNPIDSMSVAGNIKLFTLPNSIVSLRGGASEEEIYDYAARIDIEEHLHEMPDELPHADVRRLEIAKSLATEPEMMLLDEPFAGMNQAEITELAEQIERFREQGMSMVVVDHNMGGLMDLVDRIVVLNNGDFLAEGTPEEIAENEQVQEAYLAGEGL
ncbi:ABC transporter [Natrinema pellirubrum DSM 15624]|uniref:ABC transporter n=1 Tax=Natrinema pellirubrum (strain DSM 15624 / CIP 106293 / JCM 10476 / NCIMB 786 / 157) TaxID=797303 RepID=L0JQ85_NATP1|nr:ABC transporter ATP-binding protein [Natrinema pellirubrum]AGB32777.1 ABC-type branched-chain amino acid transport systems, ATPase component [Natrinema pellirubrum DSM 15624]ELY75781.1 ABC transporter [Natrinema pellirubrum DSM 15624]